MPWWSKELTVSWGRKLVKISDCLSIVSPGAASPQLLSAVWILNISDIKILECVQRKATKMVKVEDMT